MDFTFFLPSLPLGVSGGEVKWSLAYTTVGAGNHYSGQCGFCGSHCIIWLASCPLSLR